jgi:glutathione S-transferase
MSLGDGLTDLMMSRLMESLRPAERQSAAHRDAYMTKCNAALAVLEAQAHQLNHEAPTIGEIAIASALAFADFRFATDNWRHGRETLAVWFTHISERASMKVTAHVDQY